MVIPVVGGFMRISFCFIFFALFSISAYAVPDNFTYSVTNTQPLTYKIKIGTTTNGVNVSDNGQTEVVPGGSVVIKANIPNPTSERYAFAYFASPLLHYYEPCKNGGVVPPYAIKANILLLQTGGGSNLFQQAANYPTNSAGSALYCCFSKARCEQNAHAFLMSHKT